jgi:hypothetical protein
MPIVDHIATLATAPTGATAPDSITVDNGFVWAGGASIAVHPCATNVNKHRQSVHI